MGVGLKDVKECGACGEPQERCGEHTEACVCGDCAGLWFWFSDECDGVLCGADGACPAAPEPAKKRCYHNHCEGGEEKGANMCAQGGKEVEWLKRFKRS